MRPRKKWEPQYRYGGNPASPYMPKPLGENDSPYMIKKSKRKKK